MATKPNGFFDDKVVTDYLLEKGEKYVSPTVEYHLDPSWFTQLMGGPAFCSPTNGVVGNVSLGQREIVCMDIGAWIGNGPKNDKNHQRHREFGVVCGNVAVLCAFDGGESKKEANVARGATTNLSPAANTKIYNPIVRPFLQYLASPLEHSSQSPDDARLPSLGNVSILGAMEATQAVGDTSVIHVFLGDLHLPIVSDPKHPELVGPETAKAVKRAGRLDLSDEQKARVRSAVSSGEAGAATAAGGGAESLLTGNPIFAVSGALAGLGVASPGAYEAWKALRAEEIEKWDAETDGYMTRKEAAEWAQSYVGSAEKKGAEVFQDSGAELVAFLRRLQRWKRRNGERLHLVQTGDFFDFWIGLKRAFEPAKASDDPKDIQNPIHFPIKLTGFMKFWIEQTRRNHRAGPVIDEFVKMIKAAEAPPLTCAGPRDLQVTLLRGNHDNYMFCAPGTLSTSPQYHSADAGIVAEHGHQSDSFNSDQDANLGWALTQLAFVMPDVRDWEDPASTGMTFAKRRIGNTDPGARLQRVARAAEESLVKGTSIYVLGHTHQALLRKVIVRPITEPKQVQATQLTCRTDDAQCLADQAQTTQKIRQKLLESRDEFLKDAANREAKQKLLRSTMRALEISDQLQGLQNQIYTECGGGSGFKKDWCAAGVVGSEAGRAVVDAAGEKAESAGHAIGSGADAAKQAAVRVWQESVATAKRKVAEAQKAIDEAVRAGYEKGRQEVEVARKALVEAQQELETLAAQAGAAVRMHVLEVKRKVEDEAARLQRMEHECEAWAQAQLEAAHREVMELMQATRREAELLGNELRREKNKLERWGKDAVATVEAKVAQAQATLKQTVAACVRWLSAPPAPPVEPRPPVGSSAGGDSSSGAFSGARGRSGGGGASGAYAGGGSGGASGSW